MTDLKFGDIVINETAGATNPQRALLVMRVTKWIQCLARDGRTVTFDRSHHPRLTKVSEIDWSPWDEAVEQARQERGL